MINDEQKTINEIEDYLGGNVIGIQPPVDMMYLTRFLRSKIRATRAQSRDAALEKVISLASKLKEDLKCIAHHGIGEEIWRIDEFTDAIRAMKG